MPFLQLAAAALLAQAAAAPPSVTPGGQPPIRVEAPEASWDAAGGEVTLRGGVLVRRGTAELRAPEARYRPSTGEVEVKGDALLVDGRRGVVAKGLRGVVDGVYEADQPVVFFAEEAAALARLEGPKEALAVPRRLTLRADRASGRLDGGITLSGARATTCDCPPDESPTWELRAEHADVRPGERAILRWPVLWITPRFLFVDREVPVLALPWLYVPLGERQTGLLLPEFRRTAATGIELTEPFFLTLGRSADATLTGGYAFGRKRSQVRAGDPAVRGPLASAELRWAPAEQASGQIDIDWAQDLDDEPGGAHGARVQLRGRHAQRLDTRTDLRLDLDLVSDPLYGRDFNTDVLSRDAPYRRSALLVSRRTSDTVVEGGASWLQPQARDGSLSRVPGLSYGLFGADVPSFHRGPSLSSVLLPTPLAGGLLASGRAEVARFGPLSGVTNDAGATGIGPGDRGWSAAAAGTGLLDGRWEPGERLAATRALIRTGLSYPTALGRWLRIEPYLRGAAAGYAFDAAVDPVANAWGVAGATIETELSRRFGELKHSVTPRLEWRAGTGVAGRTLPAFGYDGWDRAAEVPRGAGATFDGPRLVSAAPLGSYQQGRASIETRLDGPTGSLLKLEIGQDFDLRTGDPAESFATARASLGPLTAEGAARYAGFATRPRLGTTTPSAVDDWTEVMGAVGLHWPRGYDLHASLRSLGAGGPASTQGGVDALFDLRPTTLPFSSQAAAGFTLPLGPATIGWDVLVPGREVTVPACNATSAGDTRRLAAFHVTQQTASFVWDSPWHCFRFTARVRLNDCDGFDPRDASFFAGIDVSPRESVGSLK